ncbi:glycosyltransferase family 4 protein [Streptococcus cuniculipharyngis]|uniref:Glycosyltransferase family 4 protein n=1 Tax=Streptococcus cuniculipharyngis TaxID=1562651 RepID=A0A5C5SCX4_9STRE|nr:glycosyltransferase family 4 protein [Streptococcus cuniculipharyngis]TWS98937.1 glycosyltransferase family 4 protein [Streptococcus cuniculipharyngis]
MRVGLFTDTYFPQVSGVATSIQTLKQMLEANGHEVYIFTTTDKDIGAYDDPTIIRLPSVPFISFTERRVVYRGLLSSYKIAKKYQLDIIHTQTEFSVGILGKILGRALGIPVVHTYHTQYEDYVNYIANGKVIRPSMVKYIMRGYLKDLDGLICPSRIVLNLMNDYAIKVPKRIIPTGIYLEDYVREDISQESLLQLREDLGIQAGEKMLLSLSRVSYEKNIQAILASLPEVLSETQAVKLVVAGDGPYLETLKKQAQQLGINEHVIFTGMVPHDKTALYYHAADFFISASTSETQGLTYTESLASGTPIIACANPYLSDLITNPMFGILYESQWDLAGAILEAVLVTPEKEQLLWDEKLYDISAQHFGQSVYNFYLDVLIAKANQKQEHISMTLPGSKTETSVKLVRKAISLPKSAAKKTAQTSIKAMKLPKRLVHSIKDFLD